jgi:hypothetical protein
MSKRSCAATAPTDVEITLARLDVVEVDHNDRVRRQDRPAGTQLPWDRDRWILILCGRAPHERDPH